MIGPFCMKCKTHHWVGEGHSKEYVPDAPVREILCLPPKPEKLSRSEQMKANWAKRKAGKA